MTLPAPYVITATNLGSLPVAQLSPSFVAVVHVPARIAPAPVRSSELREYEAKMRCPCTEEPKSRT